MSISMSATAENFIEITFPFHKIIKYVKTV